MAAGSQAGLSYLGYPSDPGGPQGGDSGGQAQQTPLVGSAGQEYVQVRRWPACRNGLA